MRYWKSNFIFYFNDTATTKIYTLSLHDALPICHHRPQHYHDQAKHLPAHQGEVHRFPPDLRFQAGRIGDALGRSEEHTSELQSQSNLVCRLLLEKKKNHI